LKTLEEPPPHAILSWQQQNCTKSLQPSFQGVSVMNSGASLLLRLSIY